MKYFKIFGPPGCGKTHSLMEILDQELKKGTPPDRIALVTFTKKGAEEAKQRAIEKFNFKENELPYFRTLHSMAFNAMSVGYGSVMTMEHWKDLFSSLGLSSKSIDHVQSGVAGSDLDGDLCNMVFNMARNRAENIIDTYYDLNLPLAQEKLELFQKVVSDYKEEHHLNDFTDMLEDFKDTVPVDVAIIDEAQDLSFLQWRVVDTAFADAQRMYMAGDDDQAIYKWSGADANIFRNREGEVRILNKSYRLPRVVWQLANNISSQIKQRQAKKWFPKDDEGFIDHRTDISQIDMSKGEWLLLSRNKHLLKTYSKRCRALGYVYMLGNTPSVKTKHLNAITIWRSLMSGNAFAKLDLLPVLKLCEAFVDGSAFDVADDTDTFTVDELVDMGALLNGGSWANLLTSISRTDREYYAEILSQGGKLDDAPRIKISTMHATKGGECDNVVVLSDMTKRCYTEYQDFPDETHRVFYVAVTRAKQSLFILEPKTEYYYKFNWSFVLQSGNH